MELIFIGIGILLLGGSAYFLSSQNSNKSNQLSSAQELNTFNQSHDGNIAEGLNLSQVEVLPKPQSKKPIYIAIVLGCFVGAVVCIMSALNAQFMSSSFWLFVGACILFGFGCYFMGWVRQADEWLLQDHERITKINDHRIKERQQVVRHHVATKSAIQDEIVNNQKRHNELLEAQNAQIDHQIIAGNTSRAQQLGIPVTSFTKLQEEEIRADQAFRLSEKQAELETKTIFNRAADTAKIGTLEAHNVLTETERMKYDELSTFLIDEIGNLKRQVLDVNESDLSESRKAVETENLQMQIDNKRLQLHGLQTRLSQVTDGQKQSGIIPSPKQG